MVDSGGLLHKNRIFDDCCEGKVKFWWMNKGTDDGSYVTILGGKGGAVLNI